MSSEKQNFDQVYSELANMIGFDETQDFVSYLPDSYVPPINANVFAYEQDWQALYHPYRETWLESDFEEIERIRKLGRFLIEGSKSNISGNETYKDILSGSYVEIAYDLFEYRRWHALDTDASSHSRDSIDINDEQIQVTAINPKNFANWPVGDYINCLGVSIGLVAVAELKGIDYLYVSELSDANSEFFRNFVGLENKIRKLYPKAYDEDKLPFKTITLYDKLYNDQADAHYAGMPISNPAAYQQVPQDTLRDYHHFVIMNDEQQEGMPHAVQIDPYSYIYRGIDNMADEFEAIKQALSHDSVVVFTNNSVANVYRVLTDTVNMIASKTRDHTGKRALANNILATETIIGQAASDIFSITGAETADYIAKNLPRELANITMDTVWMTIAHEMGLNELLDKIQGCLDGDDLTGLDAAQREVRDIYHANRRYDPEAKDAYKELSDLVPISMFMLFYRYVLKYYMNIRDTGVGNSAVEIAEPDFMIGAMALNHYANNRKGDKINVARYLTRYSSSQLLWAAAAIEDSESEEDPSMRAVGQQVLSLKANQQHPRVRLVGKSIPH